MSAQLEIDLERAPKEGGFALESSFTLSSTAHAINPVAEAVTLQLGTFAVTIPLGSFKEEGVGMKWFGPFTFHGMIDCVALDVVIRPTGTKRYALEATGASLTGTRNPVPVTLTIGDDSGTASVNARISR